MELSATSSIVFQSVAFPDKLQPGMRLHQQSLGTLKMKDADLHNRIATAIGVTEKQGFGHRLRSERNVKTTSTMIFGSVRGKVMHRVVADRGDWILLSIATSV